MSQAKVDRYKEEKKNRKKIMAKEKRMRIAGYVAGCLVAAGIIGWAGYSGYRSSCLNCFQRIYDPWELVQAGFFR